MCCVKYCKHPIFRKIVQLVKAFFIFNGVIKVF